MNVGRQEIRVVQRADADDAVRVVAEAMKKAGSTDAVKFLPELAAINYPGLTAEIAFDEKGDIKNGAVTVYQAKSGAWSPLETMGGQAAK